MWTFIQYINREAYLTLGLDLHICDGEGVLEITSSIIVTCDI